MSLFSFRVLKSYILSVLFSILVTLVLLGAVSIIFSFFPPAPWIMYGFSRYTVYFTAFLCAFSSAKTASGHGLVTGVVSAVVCLFILSVAGSIVFNTAEFPFSFFRLLPIGIPCGAVGGILGINSK